MGSVGKYLSNLKLKKAKNLGNSMGCD